MGYTHYFRQQRDLTMAELTMVRAAWKGVFAAYQADPATSGTLAAYNPDSGNDYDFWIKMTDPEQAYVDNADNSGLQFNGLPDCETFAITRYVPSERDGEGWQCAWFCKTEREPYDKAVTAMLVLVNTIAPGAYKIRSDGSLKEWAAGLALARSVWPNAVMPF